MPCGGNDASSVACVPQRAPAAQEFCGGPFPVCDLRQVRTVARDVQLVLYERVFHELNEVAVPVPEIDVVQRQHHEVEAVDLVLDAHIKGCGDRALLLIAAHVDVPVFPFVGQLVDEGRIAVKGKDDGLVDGEDRVVGLLRQPVGVQIIGLQAHEVDHVYNPDFQLREVFAQDGHGGQSLQSRGIAAAGHDHIRLGALVVRGPVPDADALRAVDDGLLHREPLRPRCFEVTITFT